MTILLSSPLTELPVQVVHFDELQLLNEETSDGTNTSHSDPTWSLAFDQPSCLLGCPVLWPAVGTQNHPIVTLPHLIMIIVHRVRQSTKMNILPHVNLSDPSPGLHRLSAQTQPASRLALASH
jgi:hypothetical protein